EHEHVERLGTRRLERRCAVGDRGRLEPRLAQGEADHVEDAGVVVGDEDRRAQAASRTGARRGRRTVVPRPGSLSMSTEPPWAATAWRTIARPRPNPSALRPLAR